MELASKGLRRQAVEHPRRHFAIIASGGIQQIEILQGGFATAFTLQVARESLARCTSRYQSRQRLSTGTTSCQDTVQEFCGDFIGCRAICVLRLNGLGGIVLSDGSACS